MKILRIILLCGMVAGFYCKAHAAEFDTIYLRDGQILNGTIIQDDKNNYMVYSPFGELSVAGGEVIYATHRDKTPPVIQETHILIGGTTETITITEQDVPERLKDAAAFNLLLPGVAQSVLSDGGDAIPFKSRLAGANSLVTIRYSDLPAKITRLRIALWQAGLLARLDPQSAKFEQKYEPDKEGSASVIVKYPKEWKVRELAPTPEKQSEGLIVWRQTLRRQEEFTPRIVFQFKKR